MCQLAAEHSDWAGVAPAQPDLPRPAGRRADRQQADPHHLPPHWPAGAPHTPVRALHQTDRSVQLQQWGESANFDNNFVHGANDVFLFYSVKWVHNITTLTTFEQCEMGVFWSV